MVALAKGIGASVVADFSDEVTHVITRASAAEGFVLQARPFKYFDAIITGKWIISFDCMSLFLLTLSASFLLSMHYLILLGVERTLSENRTLDEEEYEVKGDKVAMGGAKRARLYFQQFRGQQEEKIAVSPKNAAKRKLRRSASSSSSSLPLEHDGTVTPAQPVFFFLFFLLLRLFHLRYICCFIGLGAFV